MNEVKRVGGLHLTHIVTDDNETFCGRKAKRSWIASGNATCVECLTGEIIGVAGEEIGIEGIVKATEFILGLPYTPDKQVASSVTAALASLVAARLSV